jgi:hypothetical protein
VAILIASVYFEAPLLERANIKYPPNPAKSAWFLLWIQELVSYSIYTVYLLLLLLIFYILLPFIRKQRNEHLARWFPIEDRFISFLTLFICLSITILTIIAYFFRGPDWHISF